MEEVPHFESGFKVWSIYRVFVQYSIFTLVSIVTGGSLVPRPAPSFPSLAVQLSGRGPGTFSHVSDVTGRKAVERL